MSSARYNQYQKSWSKKHQDIWKTIQNYSYLPHWLYDIKYCEVFAH